MQNQSGVTCPTCGGISSFNRVTGKWQCALCGHRFEAEAEAKPQRHPIERITHRGEINARARSAFETAQYAVRRGDTAQAIAALRRALEMQPDFADAHLWLARLSDDPKVKRDHLSEIIAQFPNHLEATRDLMVLNGQLSAEAAARTHHADDPKIEQAGDNVRTTTSALTCPVCGGHLTIDPYDGHVECRFCGYRAEKAIEPAAGVGASLTMALLERKAEPVRWHIGGRLLHCNHCGAERTIPATTLSTRCPFCDTNHVIVQDQLNSFQQPDGLIPFEIDEQTATDAIREKLGGLAERFFGLFDRNEVKRVEIDGVYLPFWVFDALADVTQTRRVKQDSRRYGGMRLEGNVTTLNFRDGVYDVAIPAVSSPPPRLSLELGKIDFSRAVSYKPRLLARYPASLYDVDFDKASLEARSHAAKLLREKHILISSRSDEEITVFANVVQMQFRQLLLPAWVATLTEVDGDTRLALVNGQTGQVTLGKAQKRK